MSHQVKPEFSFWLEFLYDANLFIDEKTLFEYGTILAAHFSTIEELLHADENELVTIGIINRFDRACLIQHARLYDDKEKTNVSPQSAVSNRILENCIDHRSSTPLRLKSKLSSTLISRISFNNHSSFDDSMKKYHPERPVFQRSDSVVINDDHEKIQAFIESYQKNILPTSTKIVRIRKSTTGRASMKKKQNKDIDRVKRLTVSKSLFTRQKALITKKFSNITTKLISPFIKIKNKNNPRSSDSIKSVPCQVIINSNAVEQHRKLQINETTQSIDSLSYHDANESTRTVQPVQTLVNKRFKLGTPTGFLSRSLANYDAME